MTTKKTKKTLSSKSNKKKIDTFFPGFPKDIIKFLKELSKNNNRDWFQENKERYKSSVVAPLCDFIVAMGPRLEKISNCYVADARPHGGSMFRIYRDVRFSKDKRPYKEHAACHFRHEAGKDAHAPGFYLHVEPKEIFVGGGIWMPSNPVLDKIRQAIIEKPDKWKKICKGKTFVKYFSAIQGDGLKRPPRGIDKDHPLIDDLKRKSFFAMHEIDAKLLYTPKFITEVERTFAALSPLLEFLTQAVDLPYTRSKRPIGFI
ncbi:MAG: DUF2461 domain-containing protein [Gammaproteobacteria bacterium]|nr:DUF2461 domain-containing protein [Gammaproteobacteria bacterium]